MNLFRYTSVPNNSYCSPMMHGLCLRQHVGKRCLRATFKLTRWSTGQTIETDVGLTRVKQTDPKSEHMPSSCQNLQTSRRSVCWYHQSDSPVPLHPQACFLSPQCRVLHSSGNVFSLSVDVPWTSRNAFTTL